MLHRLRRLSLSLIFIYAGVTIGMMFLERSMIYPAPRADDGDWNPNWLTFEEATFQSADGTQLHGWFLEHPAPKATLLLFHGNGEHVAYLAGELDMLRRELQVSVMAFDYRGYGKSEGTPHERGILEDGLAAQEWLAARTGQETDSIVLLGRSIGGAVAIHAAATNGARGLVLDRTFDSMVNVAAHHMPFLPVRFLLRNRYPSSERIKGYSGPLFQVHGEPDEVIPYKFGKQLFEAAPSRDKTFYSSPDLRHNDPWPPIIFQAMNEFLQRLPPLSSVR